MSGLNEITSVVEAAKEYAEKDNNWIILPLHSSLSIADQDKVNYSPNQPFIFTYLILNT